MAAICRPDRLPKLRWVAQGSKNTTKTCFEPARELSSRRHAGMVLAMPCDTLDHQRRIVGFLNMGLTYIEGEVNGPAGRRPVRFLVDSGATYSLLAEEDWQAIGLAPKRAATFTLADGSRIGRGISECHVTLPQGEGHTPVILGESGDEPLLGVVTWEILGLVLDPFKRTLHPMRMLLV